jgi:hypothetical protein
MGVVTVAMATWTSPQYWFPRTRPHVNRLIGSKDICYIVQGGNNSGVNWGHTPIWPTCAEALTCIEYVCTRTTLIRYLVLQIMDGVQMLTFDLESNISNFSKKITPIWCNQIMDWSNFGRDIKIQYIVYGRMLQHTNQCITCSYGANAISMGQRLSPSLP